MFYNRQMREYFASRRPVQHYRHLNPRFFQQLRGFEYNTNWGWQQQLCSQSYASPETDVLELDDQIILEIALPGVVLDDVELKVEENTLTVIAKRTPAMFEERAQVLRKELPAGYLVREFEFETEIMHEQIEARLDRGILFVSIPKVEATLRIPVSAGNIESHLPGMKTRVNKTESTMRSKEVTIK